MGATVFLFLALPFIAVVAVSWIAVLRERQPVAQSLGTRLVGPRVVLWDEDLLWRRDRTIAPRREPVLVEEEPFALEDAA